MHRSFYLIAHFPSKYKLINDCFSQLEDNLTLTGKKSEISVNKAEYIYQTL